MVTSIDPNGCEYTEAKTKLLISIVIKSVFDTDDIIIGGNNGFKMMMQLRTGC